VKDIQARFAKNAKVYFYSCKSATDPQLLQEFANTFQVTAMGFKDNGAAGDPRPAVARSRLPALRANRHSPAPGLTPVG
jgi:hypothetical protein